jgi:hypothetical protein
MLVLPACGVAIMIILAIRKKAGDKGLTPELKELYNGALDGLNDPESLRKLASRFNGEGCKPEAFVMNKLADFLELPPETKSLFRELFKKAIASKDPVKVDKAAKACEEAGAIGSARALYEYAECLRKAEAA